MGKIRQMYEKADWWLEFNFIYVVLAVMLLCAVVCGWILYTDNRTANEYHDVTDTVQSVESDNREARQQIGNATAEIDSAEKQLGRSIKRTDRVTERTQQAKKRVDNNPKIIGECQNLIDAGRRDTAEARAIFADIDGRNKGTGAQADGT